MFNNKIVLVTGASGFIGSSIVEKLATKIFAAPGLEIHALARRRGRLEQLASGPKVRFHVCDLGDRDATSAVVGEINPHIVFHLASHPDADESWDQSADCIKGNILGTVNLLEVYTRCSNSTTLVYGDSTKVYGAGGAPYRTTTPVSPNSSYAISKAAAWQFCQLYGQLASVNVISIRPTLIYGPRQPQNLLEYLVKSVMGGVNEIRLKGGEQTRSPLFIDDAVDAYLLAASSAHLWNGTAINIGGAEEFTVSEIARLVVAWMNSDATVLTSPGDMRATEISRSTSHLADAKRMLGWEPRVRLREGILKLMDHVAISS